MKNTTIILFVLCCIVSLAGCKATSSGQGSSPDGADAFTFTYNDVSIDMNAEAAPVIEALGEPEGYTEQASCVFDGVDKTYSYSGFCISTYPKDGADYIYQLWFTDGQTATAEGVRIGDPESKVEQIYHPDDICGCGVYILTRGETTLTIIADGGVVSSIQYGAVIS